jgi:hypothetical protein
LRLVRLLRELKTNPQNKPVKNLRSYVAVMSYHACEEYLRRKYPQRHSLKNKLRYILTHRQEFALWEGDDKWLCGFSEWRDKSKPVAPSGKLQRLRDNLFGCFPMPTIWIRVVPTFFIEWFISLLYKSIS